jgi:hypothetical protein
MNNYKPASYTVRWSQLYPVDVTVYEPQEQLVEFLLESSDLSEAQQILDRIKGKL